MTGRAPQHGLALPPEVRVHTHFRTCFGRGPRYIPESFGTGAKDVREQE